MNRKWMMGAVCALALAAILVPGVWAQSSNTSEATNGLFTEDRDNYMDTTALGKVDQSLLFVNFRNLRSSTTYPGDFQAGGGFALGAWRLGLSLGYKVQDSLSKTEEKRDEATLNGAGVQTGNEVVVRRDAENNQANSQYDAKVIFGSSLFGVKDSFSFTGSRNERSGNNGSVPTGVSTALSTTNIGAGYPDSGVTYPTLADGTNNQEETTITGGSSTTVSDVYSTGIYNNNDKVYNNLEFGINLGGLAASLEALEPWAKVNVALEWNGNGSAGGFTRTYKEVTGTQTGLSGKISYDNPKSTFTLTPGLAGGVSLKLNDKFTLEPELAYSIGLNLSGNQYTGAKGGDETVAGYAESTYEKARKVTGISPVTGTNMYYDYVYGNTVVDERTSLDHWLTPAVTLRGDFDAIQVAFKWEPAFTFKSSTSETVTTTYNETKYVGNDKNDSYTQKITNTTYGSKTETGLAQWDNKFYVAAQFWLKPEKLRLNTGAEFSNRIGNWQTVTTTTPGVASVREETYKYENGNETPASKATTTQEARESQAFTSTANVEMNNAALYVGLTYFFNDNVNLDFFVGDKTASTLGQNASIDLLIPTTWGIQLNIRF